MNENFTGYNPAVAKMDIDEFETVGMGIYNSIVAANTKFMNGLSKVWFSQYAVDFGTVQTNNLYLAQNTVKCLVNNYIVKCVSAYNKIAESNNATPIADDHEMMTNESLAPNGTGEAFDDFLTASPDGVVGMDKEKVSKFLEDYSNEISSIISNDLSNFPLSIAFFDPDDALKIAFKNEVNDIIKTLNDKIDEVYAGVNEHITDEQDKVIEAVVASTEALGGAQQ